MVNQRGQPSFALWLDADAEKRVSPYANSSATNAKAETTDTDGSGGLGSLTTTLTRNAMEVAKMKSKRSNSGKK